MGQASVHAAHHSVSPPSLNISNISLGLDFVPPTSQKSYWAWTWCRQHLKNFIGQARVNPTDQFITGANYFHKSLSIKKSKNQKKERRKNQKNQKKRKKEKSKNQKKKEGKIRKKKSKSKSNQIQIPIS